MAVKIRLARGGAKKAPYYRVVVANSTAPRDGDFLEKVGTYNPMLVAQDPNRITLKSDRVLYWLSQGAQPTERVAKFISSAGIALPEHLKKKMAVKAKAYEVLAAKKKEIDDAAAAVKAAEEKAAQEAAAVKEAEAKAAAEAKEAEEKAAAKAKAAEEAAASAEAPAIEPDFTHDQSNGNAEIPASEPDTTEDQASAASESAQTNGEEQ